MSYAAPVSALIRTYGCNVKKKKERKKKGKRGEKKSSSQMHQENCALFFLENSS